MCYTPIVAAFFFPSVDKSAYVHSTRIAMCIGMIGKVTFRKYTRDAQTIFSIT